MTNFPSTSQTGRVSSALLSIGDMTLAMTRTVGVSIIRDGLEATMCVIVVRRINDPGGLACRKKVWTSDVEMVSAFFALQLNVAEYQTAWLLYQSWRRSDAPRAEVSVRWIAPTLAQRSGNLLMEKRTVATINWFFITGLLIMSFAAAAGAVITYVHWVKCRGAAPSAGHLTIEGSRRVLTMSKLTKFNCSSVPIYPPVSMLVRTGDNTCHLETTYSRELKPVSLEEIKADKLVTLGG